jgi:hypothetical protein
MTKRFAENKISMKIKKKEKKENVVSGMEGMEEEGTYHSSSERRG